MKLGDVVRVGEREISMPSFKPQEAPAEPEQPEQKPVEPQKAERTQGSAATARCQSPSAPRRTAHPRPVRQLWRAR